MGVKGLLANGWTHHVPARINTIRSPRFAPIARRDIFSILAAPPCPATGISINSVAGADLLRHRPRTASANATSIEVATRNFPTLKAIDFSGVSHPSV